MNVTPDFFEPMTDNAKKLLDQISQMQNIHGFTARHFVKEDQAASFIMSLHKEILQGHEIPDEELRKAIKDFAEKEEQTHQKN